MPSFIAKRLLFVVPVVFGISVLVFLVISIIPGDPALAILGAYATPDNVARINAQLGLDKPLPIQYLTWLGNVLQGDFGRSYSLNRPVIQELMERFGPTLILAAAAMVFCALFGVLAGIVSAVRQYGWQDKAITLVVLIGISTPSFFLALVLILLFAVRWKVFPTGGMFELFGGGGLGDLLWHLVLPSFTLAVVATAVVARLTRANMLEVLRQDYVRTARAKGLREGKVVYKHAFRNALVNIVPILGIQAGFVLGGAVYIESVFQWPGIGRMLVTAITTRDILLVQGGVLLVAVTYVLVNLVTDVVQALLDPRLRTR